MGENPTWFTDWFNSSYYHQLYFKRDDAEAAAFIDRLLDYLQPAEKCRMLDVACGRGRHSKMLASHGFDVTGIDISPESIRVAQEAAHDHLHFFEHDMRRPLHINYYDYTFNLFTSFGYFLNERENEQAIRSIARSLKKEGILVMDYLNSVFTELHLVPEERKVLQNVTYDIRRWTDNRFFYKSIFINDPSIQQSFQHTEKVAKYKRADFERMFTAQGLKINAVFGDYTLGAFDEQTSPRLILVAEKL